MFWPRTDKGGLVMALELRYCVVYSEGCQNADDYYQIDNIVKGIRAELIDVLVSIKQLT